MATALGSRLAVSLLTAVLSLSAPVAAAVGVHGRHPAPPPADSDGIPGVRQPLQTAQLLPSGDTGPQPPPPAPGGEILAGPGTGAEDRQAPSDSGSPAAPAAASSVPPAPSVPPASSGAARPAVPSTGFEHAAHSAPAHVPHHSGAPGSSGAPGASGTSDPSDPPYASTGSAASALPAGLPRPSATPAASADSSSGGRFPQPPSGGRDMVRPRPMESAQRIVRARVSAEPSPPVAPPPYANDRAADQLTERSARRVAQQARAEAAEPPARVMRVLPLGTGMALTGVGLAFIALRLRRN